MQIVLATRNQGKLAELKALLAPLDYEVLSQSHFDLPSPPETGATFIENALLKARFVTEKTHLPAIADDSGLVVPALQGAPGIYSARYSGANATDAENNAKLLSELAAIDLPDSDEDTLTHAYFYCAMVFLAHTLDPTPLIATAAWHGRILRTPQGEAGFGYDPLFFVPAEKCSSAELETTKRTSLAIADKRPTSWSTSLRPLQMLEDPGLYVHYPWCVRKCPYCDFNSHPLKDTSNYTAYTKQLISDFDAQGGDRYRFATVFLGGGTPSLCPPTEIALLFDHIELQADAEVTLEANPGTMEYKSFAPFLDAGVNRISLGAQSFDEAMLRKLGRIHSAHETETAFANARDGGCENINIDLMWGLPDQTVADCVEDLRQAIALDPEHISWYQLTLEPKTEFARRPPKLPCEAVIEEMEAVGLDMLDASGYRRYEVSAFAKPNRQCQHNLNYWRFGDYLGIGAGAHGKDTQTNEITRSQKAQQPRLYAAEPTQTRHTPVAGHDVVFEFMLNVLRLVEGVDQTHFKAATGRPWSHVAEQWSQLAEQNLVIADKCATTSLGFRFLDTVTGSFLRTA